MLELEEKLIELEMCLERKDNISVVQSLIHYISSKNIKDAEFNEKFNNLIKYFRKVYLR